MQSSIKCSALSLRLHNETDIHFTSWLSSPLNCNPMDYPIKWANNLGTAGVPVTKTYKSIKQGLDEALEFSKGKKTRAVVHEFKPVDVKNIRAKVGMSQSEFASAFGISVSTLRHWERGDRKPNGPALVLLTVVAKEPRVVLNALSN